MNGGTGRMELRQALDIIEKQIKELKHEYDLFFTGEIRVEPQKLRNELRRVVAKLNTTHITNTALKFRFQSLQGTFNSYQRLWDRTNYEIELGRYNPHRFRAEHKDAPREEPQPNAALNRLSRELEVAKSGLPDQDVSRLFEEYSAARTATKETGKVSMEKFRASLEKQVPELEKKLGGKVRFKVSVENGKVKVKGVRAT